MIKNINRWATFVGAEQWMNIPSAEAAALISHILHTPNDNWYTNPAFLNDIGAFNSALESLPLHIKGFLEDAPFRAPNDMAGRFQFIDLFAGIGGFRLALQSHGGRCVFSSEWDNAAKETYARNFGEIPFGDIRQFTADSVADEVLDRLVPSHDILAAGFPCQPFSRAGVSARSALNQQHGFNCTTQGTLFYDIIRIASVKRPKIIFLENVRNLKSHDGGMTFKIIESTIRELGYSFNHALINAQTLVPQKRVRCYMVAVRTDFEPLSFDITPFDGPSLTLRSILEPDENSKEYIVSEKLWQGHINRTKRNIQRGTGFTALEADLDKPANTLVARYGKDGKECLIPTDTGIPRKLTKREAARLQGYPEEYLLPEAKTPTYKQMGNSVAVPVVTELANQIINHLERNNGI